ncbi:Mediator complex, subunit Med11 [Ilyonectria robusta]
MASLSQDAIMEDGSNARAHEAFTVEENIHQLNDIDKCIVQLMSHTTTALNALTIPSNPTGATGNPPAEGTKPLLNPPAQKEAFRSSTDSFLTTLHAIDVRMKRQIMALEEAGIVNLSSSQRQDHSGPVKASLKPNGVGAVGNLDVGWLNSRGTRVERDMEGELWGKAKVLLEKEGETMRMD